MLRVFSGKAPTAADVEAELGKLELDRQAVRARLQGIESALADAYGTDTDTSALEADYVALEAKLKALALVERRLQGEKVEAAKRAALADYKRAVEAIAADWAALQAIKPRREKAGRAYFDLLSEENALRRRLRMAALGQRRDDLRAALAQDGLDPAALAAEVEALESSISEVTGATIRFVRADGRPE